MNKPDSIPSAGTIQGSSLRDVSGEIPSLKPPLEVANALVTIGQALQAIGSALAQGVPLKTSNGDTPFRVLNYNAPTVTEVAAQLLRSKARGGCSDHYLKKLRLACKRLIQASQDARIDQVTLTHLERSMRSLEGRTARNHVDCLRTLFNFAKDGGFCSHNPAATIVLPKDLSALEPPKIHTPAEVRKVLETMQRADLNVCRFLAIRYFAGLRATEAQRCVVQLERGFIEVPAKVAKTRSRRLVQIEPNLAAWLRLGGELPVRDLNTRVTRVAKLSDVEWHANVTRHSFCSYHLAHFRDAARTALEAGHSEAMLFGNYRELVTRQDAAEFWNISP